MNQPLGCYLPLRVKLILLGTAAMLAVIGIGLGIAVIIDWIVGRFG